jgi:hypothetical protein
VQRHWRVPTRWDLGVTWPPPRSAPVINEFSQAIAKRLPDRIKERLSVRPQRTWQETYSLAGSGSTYRRARRISDDIFARNVPVPGATPSPDQNDFLHSVIEAVIEAADESGVHLK